MNTGALNKRFQDFNDEPLLQKNVRESENMASGPEIVFGRADMEEIYLGTR